MNDNRKGEQRHVGLKGFYIHINDVAFRRYSKCDEFLLVQD